MLAGTMTAFTDIRSEALLLRLLPARVRPYGRLARLDRPAGTWLLLFPCWWGMALALYSRPLPWFAVSAMALLFALGALIMRSAGCVVNDLADRKIDRLVERTAKRPLASGEISVGQAIAFLVLLLAAGFAVLVQFNWASILIGACSLALVFPYPLMKRITYWPQAFLGLTFNWGVLVGWTAVAGELGWPALLLYAAGVFWTLGYDSIYAFQDIRDDRTVGVKSSALKIEHAPKPWIAGFYAAMWLLAVAALWTAGAGPLAPLLLLPALAQLLWQLLRWQPASQGSSLRIFKANAAQGWLVLAGLAAGLLLT